MHPELSSTGRFRVNANGGRHDVWLIYRCDRCNARRGRRLWRRVRADAGGVPLDDYRRNDPALALGHAFALGAAAPIPYVVERPPLPACGVVVARIEQPLRCGVRWDRFLARELGWSRSHAAAALRRGDVSVSPRTRPNRAVRHGDRVELRLPRT
jgi:hypothetical protein